MRGAAYPPLPVPCYTYAQFAVAILASLVLQWMHGDNIKWRYRTDPAAM